MSSVPGKQHDSLMTDKNQEERTIPEEIIAEKIMFVRGKKVMVDRDLAQLYGVGTKVLKQAVRRNIERFPEDFMFELNKEEYQILRSQFVTSSWGGPRYLPMVFTEQGVAMLSSVLNSNLAIRVNIQIIRVFSKFRSVLETHKELLLKIERLQLKDLEHDKNIKMVFEILKKLDEERKNLKNLTERKRIGLRPDP
jgi:hypothetical protein